jgi:hypothetical protein
VGGAVAHRRIYHVLESGRKFAAADMLALENDVQSENDLLQRNALYTPSTTRQSPRHGPSKPLT